MCNFAQISTPFLPVPCYSVLIHTIPREPNQVEKNVWKRLMRYYIIETEKFYKYLLSEFENFIADLEIRDGTLSKLKENKTKEKM